jgi:hypothetical protein
MQKLTHTTRIGIGNNRGSALVIAVALALLMAIAGIGFLLVTTNSINNDSAAYTRDKAHYAAESGALLAAKSIMSRAYNNWASGTFLSNQPINGLNVTVIITRDLPIARQATVDSKAYASDGTLIKRVVMVIQND